jgi:hypothetical protein
MRESQQPPDARTQKIRDARSVNRVYNYAPALPCALLRSKFCDAIPPGIHYSLLRWEMQISCNWAQKIPHSHKANLIISNLCAQNLAFPSLVMRNVATWYADAKRQCNCKVRSGLYVFVCQEKPPEGMNFKIIHGDDGKSFVPRRAHA